MLDYYIGAQGRFPNFNYLKNKIGHNILLIYNKSLPIIKNRLIQLNYLKDLEGVIHKNILTVLSDFSQGDRYSNINLLAGNRRKNDPVASWFNKVDQEIFKLCVSDRRKLKIESNARIVDQMIGGFSLVRHTSETGTEITDVEEASSSNRNARSYSTISSAICLANNQILG